MWLARRSSSRAMPRMVWARGVFRLRARASIAPQAALAWPMTVSPAIDSATRTAVGPAPGFQQALDPAVLVAQHDLQEQHLLAVRLEPEVSRLDDPGVDRPDRHLVDFLTLELEERVALPVDRLRRVPALPWSAGCRRTGLSHG